MPLFVIPAAGILISLAGFGATKGVGGARKMARAKKIASQARKEHEQAIDFADRKRAQVNREAGTHAQTLIRTKDVVFKKAVEILEKTSAKRNETLYERLAEVGFNAPEIPKFKQAVIYMESLLEGGAKALAAGTSAGPAAMTGAVLFGAKAGTGATIGSLSGVAAKNALLAWFGGGSIAAGGGGMALGTLMLGGIVLAPAIFTAGCVLSKKGEKALSKAMKYQADVRIATEKIRQLRSFLDRVIAQIRERDMIMRRLNQKADFFIDRIDAERFDPDNDKDAENFRGLMSIVAAQSTIMQAPVLNQQGTDLDATGVKVVAEYRTLI